MLAVVQPYSATTPDVAHRALRSNISSSAASSRPVSANLASNPPPSLQRHQTAPPAPPSHTRTPTPPPKPTSPTPQTVSTQEAPFDINSYPATDLLKLLALLLTHIATTNDPLALTNSGSSSHGQQVPPEPIDAPPIWHTLTTASRNAISTPAATLTFHARNIPTITLEAYLLRILKYCPTSNHVFLSLLVYFDRMSKLSEDAVGRAFVIDSYNIHRLVIAGVTVASKFFSDVFYTNSRYAKVGGLPLPELNQLELQFLLLNDFRLVISSTEMQHYAEQLILFAKSTSSTNGHIHLPTVPNGHAHPSPSEQHQHQHHHHHHHQPIPPPTPASTSSSSIATSTTSQSGSNSSGSSSNRTITNVPPPQPQSQTQPPPGLGPSPHLDTQTHRVSPTSPFHSSTTGPARPLDALGGVPAPVHNPTAHPAYLLHTHPPHSHQHVHPAGYAQTALADQPHLQAAFAQVPLQQLGLQQMHGMLHHHHHHHHEQQQQQQQRGPSHLRSQSYPALGVPLHRVHPHADPNEQRTPGSEPLATSSSSIINPSVSSSSNSTNSFSEPEHDAEDDDADTSTDAGTETSTDEEPTIRAPRTVTGSVWGDADAEVEREEEDARMRSP